MDRVLKQHLPTSAGARPTHSSSSISPLTPGHVAPARPHRLRTLMVALGACAMAAAHAGSLSVTREAAGAATKTPIAAVPTAAPAGASKAVRSLLLPNAEATLGSQRLGRVTSLAASIGMAFSRGQVLVELDCSEPKAQIDVLKVELAAAVETYEAKLLLKGLEQASDVEVTLAASAVQKVKAQINQLMVQVDQCTIRAPWAGHVIKIHTRRFSTVGTGDPLMDVVRDGPLRVRMNIASDLVGKIKLGDAFSIRVDETAQEYAGRLLHINARVDPVSQILEIEGILNTAYPGLLPGMSGEAQFPAIAARKR